jgi:hypothetical protein
MQGARAITPARKPGPGRNITIICFGPNRPILSNSALKSIGIWHDRWERKRRHKKLNHRVHRESRRPRSFFGQVLFYLFVRGAVGNKPPNSLAGELVQCSLGGNRVERNKVSKRTILHTAQKSYCQFPEYLVLNNNPKIAPVLIPIRNPILM